jgi:hypothetical protein
MPDAASVQRHRGTGAIQRMIEFAPATGGLALWVRHQDTDDASPLTTDGTTLRYGRAFEAFDLDLQTGLIAHAVLHVGLRHPQRYLDLQASIGDVDLRLFNICADAIVNSTIGHLGWLRLPAGSVFLEQLLDRVLGKRITAEEALLAWDVEALYRAVDDRRSGRGRERIGNGAPRDPSTSAESAGQGGRDDGPNAAAARSLGSGIVADLAPAPDPSKAPEHAADDTRTWTERLVRAHASDAAFSLLRTLVADLPQVRTPWEQALRVRLARALSTRPSIAWSRPTRSYLANQGRAGPHRRLPWEPGFSGMKPVPRLIVIVDVSGSIDDDLMARFATEIEAITRRLEAGLVLIVGDDRVRSVTRFAPGRSDLRDIVFDGGGGTDFTPLLEEADRHRPDLAVVLTDLDGPARFRPSWPVVWAVPDAHGAAVAPFGRKLVLR